MTLVSADKGSKKIKHASSPGRADPFNGQPRGPLIILLEHKNTLLHEIVFNPGGVQILLLIFQLSFTRVFISLTTFSLSTPYMNKKGFRL